MKIYEMIFIFGQIIACIQKTTMNKIYFFTATFGLLFFFSNCSRKTLPPENTSRSVYGSDKPVAAVSSRPVTVKKIKTPVPKIIVVNDSIASKTFDGRLYYDLEGHRYWRNYKDGKYYLFNKSMATDPAFKKT